MVYFGDKEVKSTAESENGKVGILFVDDTNLTIPKWEFEIGQSEESRDLMWIKNARCNKITEKLLGIMLEMNVRLEDLNLISMKLTESVKQNYQKAIDKKFGKTKNELAFVDIDSALVDKI